MNSLKKGFTLIELLVVIAIIGILAAVVLASLGQARSRARDASAKAELSSMRAEAELLAGDTSDYSVVCDGSSTAWKLYDAAREDVGATDGSTARCNASSTAWAAGVTLTNGQIFCVDSTARAGESPSVPSAEVCP